MSDGAVGLASAMRGLPVANDAVLGTEVTVDAYMKVLAIKRLVRASDACRRSHHG